MEDTLTLYTSVKPALYRKALLKSSIAGISGAFILVFATIFLPQIQLEFWGPILGLISLFLIGFGFRPFLKIKRLDSKPIALKLTKENILWNNVRIVTKNIESAHYIDAEENYGIEIISKTGQKLFLPYYSKRSFEEVLSYLNDGLDAE